MKKVGVLAVQGAFIEHENILNKIGVETFEIRQKKDLERDFDGLIIPGGESTVIGKLARELDMQDTLVKKINDGMPVFGTCAGLLVLAKKIENDDRVHFATMDIVAKRNAYGRQLGSFSTEEKFGDTTIPMRFIRAPYIETADEQVQVLAHVDDRIVAVQYGGVEILSVVDGKIVAARQGNQLVSAFHPELTDSTEVHKYFAEML